MTRDSIVKELREAEKIRLLVCDSTRGTDDWQFHNPEVQAAAYGTLLHKQRVEIHKTCAKKLVELDSAEMTGALASPTIISSIDLFRLRDLANNISEHYANANDCWHQAAEYKRIAGQLW